MFRTILSFELLLYARRFGESLNLLAMFMLSITAFAMSQPHGAPLGDGVQGILWTIALLILSLTHYRIFLTDYEDGTMNQWHHLPITPELIVLAKLVAHWLMTALPLAILTPLALLMLAPDMMQQGISTILSLLVGSFGFTAIGTMAAAVSLQFHTRDILTSLIMIPLATPLIIFGAAAANTPIAEGGSWLLLIAFSAIIVCVSVIASALLVKLSS
jgi:heme exporter protein B